MKTKINQTGSHVVGIVLVICFICVAVFVGFRVIAGHKVAVDSKTEAKTPTAPQPTLAVPAGWKLFADKSVGVQFIYPASAGMFTRPDKSQPGFESSLISGNIAANFLPGVTGPFTLGTYKTADPEVSSRRYGPQIQLKGSDWIVTAPNQYDPKQYKKGDVYPEITQTNTHGIDVYTATTGDEGVTQYELYFVSQGKMHVLQLPSFDSGLDSSTYNVNDQTPYDTMYAQVRDSISLY